MDLNVDLLGGGTFFGRMSGEERVRARLPRAQRLSNRPDWFRITNSAEGSPARLDIYDDPIGEMVARHDGSAVGAWSENGHHSARERRGAGKRT